MVYPYRSRQLQVQDRASHRWSCRDVRGGGVTSSEFAASGGVLEGHIRHAGGDRGVIVLSIAGDMTWHDTPTQMPSYYTLTVQPLFGELSTMHNTPS